MSTGNDRVDELVDAMLSTDPYVPPPRDEDLLAEHIHDCILGGREHSICTCACGATALNTMGEPEWSPTPIPPAQDDDALAVLSENA